MLKYINIYDCLWRKYHLPYYASPLDNDVEKYKLHFYYTASQAQHHKNMNSQTS